MERDDEKQILADVAYNGHVKISTKKRLTLTSLPKLKEVTTCVFSEIIVSDRAIQDL